MKSKLILALVAALGLASPAQAASGGLQFSLDAQPEKVRELTARWDDYVKANNVVLPNRSPFEPKDAKHPPPEDPGFPPLKLKRPFVPPADMLAEPKP